MFNVISIQKKIFEKKSSITLLMLLQTIFLLSSCEKMVLVDPPITASTGSTVFSTDAGANAIFIGIYSELCYGMTSGGRSISVLGGVASDELNIFEITAGSHLIPFYRNELSATQTESWGKIYSYIHRVNSAIEGLTVSEQLAPSTKQVLLGEAKFLRAFMYFYLINFYGDVPLALTSDYRVNAALKRTLKEKVYEQIIADLKESQILLPEDYTGPKPGESTLEKVRPNKWVATALLARVYLYTGQWADAEEQTTAIIENKSVYDTVSLSDVFLKNNKEIIWNIQPVGYNFNTDDAVFFTITEDPVSYSDKVYLSECVWKAFEPGDQRKIKWVGSYTTTTNSATYHFPSKYKAIGANVVTEYPIIFRLAEQYLIRAEARAQQNIDISGAQSDLNIIRARAGLSKTTANDQASLLDAILQERQVELFTEWGHRWFDLIRTGKINTVMSSVTPNKRNGTWQNTDQLYPIPLEDIRNNPNLTQNPGY